MLTVLRYWQGYVMKDLHLATPCHGKFVMSLHSIHVLIWAEMFVCSFRNGYAICRMNGENHEQNKTKH